MNAQESASAGEQVRGLVAAVFEYPNLTIGTGNHFCLDAYTIFGDETGQTWAVYFNGEILSLFNRVLDAVEFVLAQLLYNRCAAYFASQGLELADLSCDLEGAPHD